MSKSIVKKALEIIDDDDNKEIKSKSKLISIKKKKKKTSPSTIIQDRKQLARTCLTLKKMSKSVVSSDQIEQLNNYRFGGPSKRDLQHKKKKEKEEEIFTEEDFKRFEREYNPPLQKS
jgi:predicted transcriptional regulator